MDPLEFHHIDGIPGKISIKPTKPCDKAEDLANAYTPGVAAPVLEIKKDPRKAYKYTTKGNLVAVITNGTAVLGLGYTGALASKPVMEGKSVLFKKFADIDVFDIEIEEQDPDRFVEIVKAISPSFGGINLEDIKCPECFHIENRLIEECDIPVFHDDQHGTAIIAAAGLINASKIVEKSIGEMRIVVNGAGAAGLSCARMFLEIGAKPENLILCDKHGVIRDNYPEKIKKVWKPFINNCGASSLKEAVCDSDMFLGASVKGVLTSEMLLSMNKDPIVFALANPEPEISYNEARSTRSDCIVATGRSDYPNQINNVLGFPAIFRGALDAGASKITDKMKIAAVYALSRLAEKEVPACVSAVYGGNKLTFGRNYIIPKPFDRRVVVEVASSIVKTAVEEGVATMPFKDLEEYEEELRKRLSDL